MDNCDKDNKNFQGVNPSTSGKNNADFNRRYTQSQVQQAKQLSNAKKLINQKRQRAANCSSISNDILDLLKNFLKQKFCKCPTCDSSNRVEGKVAGKNYFTIPFTDFRIPRFDHLIFNNTVSYDSNRRKGEKCTACGGKKKIPDVTDDSAKYTAAAATIKQNSAAIMEKEAKLGLGGTRTTIIQGSDVLFVGLGFNANKTYEVIPGGSIAPTMRGGKIPQQSAIPVNGVVGKQGSLAWPQQVGNYTIKCANKFSLLAGAGGMTFATPGPLTISSGMTKFIGPQIAISCATGPLTLEGNSVNVTGKTISLTPTGGEVFVKGNVSITANSTTLGHAHAESLSFIKGTCVGVTKSTYTAKANPDVLQTQPATWGYSSTASAILDLQTYYQSIPTDSKTAAFRLLSPKENINISDRIANIAQLAVPIELKITGYVLPGTSISMNGSVLGTCPCNYGGQAFGRVSGLITGTTLLPIPLHNVPHVHGIPEMMHRHEMLLPDMDYTNDSPEAVRGKVLNGAHESGVPANPAKDTKSRLVEAARTTVEFVSNIGTEATKLVAKIKRRF